MIEKIKKYIIAGISLLFGAFIPYVFSFLENTQLFLYFLSILLFCLGLALILFYQYQQRIHTVRYSILIFAINSQKKLLTVYNEYHKRLMIPCGIIGKGLTPNEEFLRFIDTYVGVDCDDYENISAFLKPNYLSNVICPRDSQIEFVTKHEKHVKTHYAFIYFIKLKDGVNPKKDVQFFSLNELMSMPSKDGLFSDILERYRHFLNEI